MKIYPIVILLSSIVVSSSFAGSNFNISPTPGKTFPTGVNPGSTVSAYYTIINNTRSSRLGYQIKGLPSTVTQNTSAPGNCLNPINLAAKASCILQLDISGEAKSSFAICKGSSCTSASLPLNVSLDTSSTLQKTFIAGGFYSNGVNGYPLLARSESDGLTWNYVVDSSITSFLPPDYLNFAEIKSLTCSNMHCIAVGSYTTLVNTYPLIATSINAGINWTYTLSTLSPTLPVDFSSNGFFESVSCSSAACIAVGSYNNGANVVPLVAKSSDNGLTWSYVVTSTIPAPPGAFIGNNYFKSASCFNHHCIAVGVFNSTYPLIATSLDDGANWSYTMDNTSPALPANFFGGSLLVSASCSTQGCIAGGYYNINGTDYFPILFLSTDNGATWTNQVSSLSPALPPGFTDGYLSKLSCSGQYCIASGFYNSLQSPLLLSSTDGGLSWSYKIDATTPALPADVNGVVILNTASCSGQNCIASGRYGAGATVYPLLANSIDGGLSWNYSINSSSPSLPLDYVTDGSFENSSCEGQICIAFGSYTNNLALLVPLLATSTDGGISWNYTITGSTPALPADFSGNGYFNAATIASGQ